MYRLSLVLKGVISIRCTRPPPGPNLIRGTLNAVVNVRNQKSPKPQRRVKSCSYLVSMENHLPVTLAGETEILDSHDRKSGRRMLVHAFALK